MLIPVVIAVLVVVGVAAAFIYNSLVRLRNRTDNAWSQIEVQLKRRYDLIPNLVETVKGYASHEQATFERVVQARNRAMASVGAGDKAEAENLLTGALRQLFALAESYPQLQANQNFSELQSQLTDTENKIAVARQIYNDSVLTFNNRVQTIPSNLVAAGAGFQTRAYFDVPDGESGTPEVRF
jgi:LemA protein